MNLQQAIVAMGQGVLPLVPMTMALVEWAKKSFALTDERIINIVSMLVGVVLGSCYMLAQQMPTDFAGWFLLVLYGVTLGLVASGLYKVGATMAAKAK